MSDEPRSTFGIRVPDAVADVARRAWQGRVRLVGGLLVAGLAVGLLVQLVVTHKQPFFAALEKAAGAPLWLTAMAVLLPAMNWLLVAWSFQILNARYGKVGAGEMTALVGASWLLNYLPLRPGMFGRVAYHRRYNGIGVRDSVRILIVLSVLTGVSLVLLLGAAALGGLVGGLGGERGAMLAVFGLGAVLCVVTPFGWGPMEGDFAKVLALRYLDALAWVGRYAVVFALVDRPLSVFDAVAVAFVSQVVLLLPVVGNGLGVREVAIALVAGLLPGWAGDLAVADRAAVAAAADLINRGVEVAVAVPVGAISMVYLARLVARDSARRRAGETGPGGDASQSGDAGQAGAAGPVQGPAAGSSS